MMKELNTFQKYFVEEFYDDYREGLISRRAFIRRLAYITGSMAAAASTMSLLGCAPSELPDPTEPTNLEKLGGRGLLLMRTFMDEVRYNDVGNEVTLIKRKQPANSGQISPKR